MKYWTKILSTGNSNVKPTASRIFNKGIVYVTQVWIPYFVAYFINLWISYRNRARINTEFLRNRESPCESTPTHHRMVGGDIFLFINSISRSFIKILSKYSRKFSRRSKKRKWKKVEKMFGKFWINFTLDLKKFLIKFEKFWIKLWKDWKFCK